MRINLIDPGLRKQAGHHFDLDLKLVRWLSDHGHVVRVYSHRDIIDEVRVAFEPLSSVTPLFRSGPYVNPRRHDPYAGELIVYQGQSQLLAEDLRQTAASDLWLLPTITAAQLKAISVAGVPVPVSACIHTPLVTDEYPHGEIWWRDAFLAAHKSGMVLNLGALEAEHRYDYSPLTIDGRFNLFPSYFDGLPIDAPRSELKTIGFFGHQRREKGAYLIQNLVDALLSQGFKVILHDSNRTSGVEEQSGVSFVGFVSDLAVEMAKCDLIIMPYEPERYKRKGSGVLMEALAGGIPSVVPFGTVLGRWIDETGAGTTFFQLEANQVLSAIEKAKESYNEIARAAYDASLIWKQKHGMDRFAMRLIEISS